MARLNAALARFEKPPRWLRCSEAVRRCTGRVASGLQNVCDDDADSDDVPDSVDPDPLDPNVPTPEDCELDPHAVACCKALAEMPLPTRL